MTHPPQPEPAPRGPLLPWPAQAALAVLLVAAPLIWLLPLGSFPVGYDVWWNLLVAETWASSGFPEAMPAAGFTDLAASFGSRQYAFVQLLALCGGAELDQRLVAPMCWGFAVLQGVALLGALAWLGAGRRDGHRPGPHLLLWVALLPALSSTWLFRATALRDLLLGQVVLILLVAAAVRPGRGRLRDLAPLGLAYGFTMSHGAVVLPLVVVAAVCAGRWLDRRRGHPADGHPTALQSAQNDHPLRPLLAVLAGCALGVLARPDAPAVWPILWSLNVEMPWAALTGSVTVRPQEFRAYGLLELLGREAPLLLAAVWIGFAAWRRRLAAALWVPALLLVVLALLSSRLFEVAAPLVLLALALSANRAVGWIAAVAFLPALLWQADRAAGDVAGNQELALPAVGDALAARGQPGDVVFVTDWGVASPLAWFTRDTGLVFTGMTDPVLMHSHDPEAHHRWEQAKLGRTGVAFTAREHFDARFLVFREDEGFWGRPAGSLAEATNQELGELRFSGQGVRGEILGPWRLVEFVGPR